jgi:hypothetical protein
MARYLKEMSSEERRRGLAYIETTIQELLAVADRQELDEGSALKLYDLLAKAVITKARITSIKGGVNHD